MRISLQTLHQRLTAILLDLGFPEFKAELCARIFTNNSRAGVYSHGLNRFPVFIQHVKQQRTDPYAEPVMISSNGVMETWDGRLGAGMYNASLCMERAVTLAKSNGMACVSIKNTNHWMRGGTYGWQAADAGCIGICFTNAIGSMPAWGGAKPVLGNNPLVIAVPRAGGHVVLDMAMSQFSYGKMQEYQLRKEQLPFPGGYDEQGNLTTDPATIRKTKRALPIGHWKGSGLALVLDILLTALSGGRSTPQITATEHEFGVTQCFIAIYQPHYHEALINEIIRYTKDSEPVDAQTGIYYPGERTLQTRRKSETEGVLVDETIWNTLPSPL
ncbi:MAG TPA: 3-dehydro-L-gulonate 2-dehydrogenase [Chitinophagaceae bacterium]|nr:3-dehydro-L-gulonate 2-dehydrogenase [Chitinophagaceae bacterium]